MMIAICQLKATQKMMIALKFHLSFHRNHQPKKLSLNLWNKQIAVNYNEDLYNAVNEFVSENTKWQNASSGLSNWEKLPELNDMNSSSDDPDWAL